MDYSSISAFIQVLVIENKELARASQRKKKERKITRPYSKKMHPTREQNAKVCTFIRAFIILKAKTLNRSTEKSFAAFTTITTEMNSFRKKEKNESCRLVRRKMTNLPVLISPQTLHNGLGTPILGSVAIIRCIR